MRFDPDSSPPLGMGAGAPSSGEVNFLLRVLSTVCLGALIASALFLFPPWLFNLGACFFILVGLYEFFTLLRKRGAPCFRLFGVVIGAVIPLVVHFQLGVTQSGEVLFIVLACLGLFIIQLSKNENPSALEGIAITFFGIMYVSWFLSYLIKIRYLAGGEAWIFYLLVVTKVGDMAAYGVGHFFGRHALIPRISPKKSVEGTGAGLFSSTVASLCFYGRLPYPLPWTQLLLLGILIGLVGQCGDLSESLIKRYCGVKDSGKVIPGMGGVLDIADSVLLTTPLFFFYVKTL